MTVAGTTIGGVALLSGTALAHYCYLLPTEGSTSAKANGSAWATQAEAAGFWEWLRAETEASTYAPPTTDNDPKTLPPPDKATCITMIGLVLERINDLPEGTLFMGPGLLAGGAVDQGKLPRHGTFGHLSFKGVDFACEVYTTPPPAP